MESFMLLGLKEVSYVIKTLGICTEIPYLHGSIDIDGKLYIYEKKGNELTITGEDGKSIKVAINYSVQDGLDERGNYVVRAKHEVYFNYGLDNGEHLEFYKTLGLDPGFESFEDVNRHDLLDNLKTKYTNAKGEEVANFSLELTAIHLKDSNKTYAFRLGENNIPISIQYEDGVMSIVDTSTLDEEASKAASVRENILDGMISHTISPEAIESVERKFRADVFAYKNQKNSMNK